jgi:transcriptional adapter 2-alpha
MQRIMMCLSKDLFVFDLLLNGMLIVAENKLRNRIAELQEYRRNGCITLEQGSKYDRDKATRVSPAQLVTLLTISIRHSETVLNSSRPH